MASDLSETAGQGRSGASPAVCNNHALRKATRQLSQLYDDVLEPSGLRGGQFALMSQAAAMDGPTMKELAAALVMDLSALGHTLLPLRRDGFIRLEPDARDARAKRVYLTAEGKRKQKSALKLWHDAQGRAERAMGQANSKALRQMLSVISSPEFAEAFREGRRVR